jgi:hypothetical protein
MGGAETLWSEVAPLRPPVEEDTVPPVTLTAATPIRTRRTEVTASPTGPAVCAVTRLASADAETVERRRDAPPIAPRLMFSSLERQSPRRGHLRLVSSQEAASADVHGRGGPASCGCRDCTMARHPAFGPKLTLI